jgi:hypothetical protein
VVSGRGISPNFAPFRQKPLGDCTRLLLPTQGLENRPQQKRSYERDSYHHVTLYFSKTIKYPEPTYANVSPSVLVDFVSNAKGQGQLPRLRG